MNLTLRTFLSWTRVCEPEPLRKSLGPRSQRGAHAPRRYVARGYNVVRWTEMRKGGHFAAVEEPGALAEDIRLFARQFHQMEI